MIMKFHSNVRIAVFAPCDRVETCEGARKRHKGALLLISLMREISPIIRILQQGYGLYPPNFGFWILRSRFVNMMPSISKT